LSVSAPDNLGAKGNSVSGTYQIDTHLQPNFNSGDAKGSVTGIK
jgi:hypothetical protein